MIGALIIIILFALLVWRGISISLKAKDKFGSLLGIGLSAQVGLQVILNIAVVTNTIPNTGISLPFFSYGGTSLVILLAQMGVVLSISRTSMIERGSALAGLPFLLHSFQREALLGVKAKAPAAWRAFNIGARSEEFFYSKTMPGMLSWGR